MAIKQNSYAGGVPMVQIDGARIRAFREEKGLTQLYLATAVEVTTDTISRWENKRYPTIKKENAVKLAEALEVALEEIIDTSDLSGSEEVGSSGETVALGPEVGPDVGVYRPTSSRGWWIFILAILVIGIGVWLTVSSVPTPEIEAVRFMPAHTAPGQPFPVVIKIISTDSGPSPFILREMLPEGTTVVESQKSMPAAIDHKTGEMKWISKVKERMVLGYSLGYSGPMDRKGLEMKGTVTLRKFADTVNPVSGNNRIEFAPFHWADANKDNFIDDLEILAVYEDYSDATGLDLEMDLIEDIWFGSGYVWNSKEMKFEVIP